MRHFPAFLDLSGRAALVVGGGEIALRKTRLLCDAHAVVTVVAPRAHIEIEKLAANGEVVLHRRAFWKHDLTGQVLVYSATGQAEIDEAVARVARAAGILVNVVDRPGISTFITPAIVDRDPVTVAVSSGGSSPVLARQLREKIEALLPNRLGALARFAERFRPAVRAAIHDGASRRAFWESFFRGPLAARLLAGDEARVAGRMLALVNRRPDDHPVEGQVAIVGAGPGSPDLLTLRALQLLQEADVVVHDSLVGPEILATARRDAACIQVGGRKGHQTLPQTDVNTLLVQLARDGKRVVRLKGGDPLVFGRGGEEAIALRRAGVDVEIVPGVTAALACAARAAIPLTHRDVAHAVTFVTGHSHDAAEPDWAAIATLRQTVVVYMGVSAAAAIADRLIAQGLAPMTPCAVVENATLPTERTVVGTLAGLAQLITDHGISGPATLIIGEVVSLGAVPAEQDVHLPLREMAGR